MNKKKTIIRKRLLEAIKVLSLDLDVSFDMQYWRFTDGEFIHVTKSCEKITGYTPEEFTSRSELFESIIYKEDVKKWKEHRSLVRNGEPHEAQFRINHKNGKLVWIEHICQKIYDDDDLLIGFRGSNRDITKRKLTTEVNETSPTVLFLWENKKGWPITFVSENIEKLADYKSEDITSKQFPYRDLIYKEDISRVAKEVEKFSKAEAVEFKHKPYRIVTKNGKTKWVDDLTHIIKDSKGKITHYKGSITDITDIKETEKALRESEEWFSAITKQSAEGITVANRKGEYVFVNPTFCKMMGYKKEELLKMTVFDTGIDRNRKSHFKDAKETDEGILFIGELKRKDNSTFPVETLGKRIKIGGEKLVLGIVNDISERRQTEIALQKLSTAVNQSASIVVVTDTEGSLEYINPRFTEVTGYTAEEALGQNPRILSAGTQPKEKFIELWNTITKGNTWTGEFHNKTKDGVFFWEQATISPIKDQSGKIINYIGIKENITAKKETEEKMKKYLEELKEANELLKNNADELAILNANKDKFFSIISHDLRSPFMALMGIAQIISEEMGDLSLNDLKSMTKTVTSSTRQLYKLIENLLSWSRLQMGSFKIKPEELSIKEVALSAKQSLQLFADEKQITIINNIQETYAYADENCLDTVFRNLINNSIKFTNSGGEILLSTNETELLVEISVEDNGIGMSKNRVETIFSITEKNSMMGTNNEPGTGLGLILCKELIEKNNGKIWVTSKLDKGSKFCFTLPKP